MVSANRVAEVAAAVGDPARAAILITLMDGRALTASELARAAGVLPSTASAHLARLVGVGLLRVEVQGRHRYHRLADDAVARLVEQLMLQGATGNARPALPRTGPRDEALCHARTCYDHLAGRLGVILADAIVGRGYVEIDDEAGLVTAEGQRFFHRIGLVISGPLQGHRASHRPMCRWCLDWSERRPHLAGRLGAALCQHSVQAGWVRRRDGTRAVMVTPKGLSAFVQTFGCDRQALMARGAV